MANCGNTFPHFSANWCIPEEQKLGEFLIHLQRVYFQLFGTDSI